MTKAETIKKIKDLGFTPTLWEKHDKVRIYVDFKYQGSKRKAGFLSEQASKLLAPPCGKHTKAYQEKLDEILEFQIEWDSTPGSTAPIITQPEAAAKAAKEIEWEGWMDTHGL